MDSDLDNFLARQKQRLDRNLDHIILRCRRRIADPRPTTPQTADETLKYVGAHAVGSAKVQHS